MYGQLLPAHRLGEVEALAAVCAQIRQPSALVGRLHPGGDDGQPEPVSKVDDRGHNLLAGRGLGEPGDEAATDLERMEREGVEMAESRIHAPEVIQGEPDAQRAELREDDERTLLVPDQHPLGHLEREQPRSHAAGVEGSRDQA